jgi:hypothetical protein
VIEVSLTRLYVVHVIFEELTGSASRLSPRTDEHLCIRALIHATAYHLATVYWGLEGLNFLPQGRPVSIRCVVPGPRFGRHYLTGQEVVGATILLTCRAAIENMCCGTAGQGRYCRHSARVSLRPAIVQAVRTQSAGSTFQSRELRSISENMVPGLLTAIGTPSGSVMGNGAPKDCSVEAS